MKKTDPTQQEAAEQNAASELDNELDMDKSHAESIATDIFGMIESAAQSGLNTSDGFQNRPLSTPNMGICYLFLPRQDILSIPNIPDEMKRRVRLSNVLGVVEEQGKISGIHLLCALDVPFGDVTDEATVLANIQQKGVDGFTDQLRVVLGKDLAANVPDESAQTDTEN